MKAWILIFFSSLGQAQIELPKTTMQLVHEVRENSLASLRQMAFGGITLKQLFARRRVYVAQAEQQYFEKQIEPIGAMKLVSRFANGVTFFYINNQSFTLQIVKGDLFLNGRKLVFDSSESPEKRETRVRSYTAEILLRGDSFSFLNLLVSTAWAQSRELEITINFLATIQSRALINEDIRYYGNSEKGFLASGATVQQSQEYQNCLRDQLDFVEWCDRFVKEQQTHVSKPLSDKDFWYNSQKSEFAKKIEIKPIEKEDSCKQLDTAGGPSQQFLNQVSWHDQRSGRRLDRYSQLVAVLGTSVKSCRDQISLFLNGSGSGSFDRAGKITIKRASDSF